MAWYYGTFACDHEDRIQLYGKMKDREWKAERAFSGLCPSCYEEKVNNEREEENKKNAELAKKYQLPELSGTEKQVAWANTLRQRLLQAFEDFCVKIEEMNNIAQFEHYMRIIFKDQASHNKNKDEVLKELKQLCTYLIEKKTSASFYIETRDSRIIDYYRRYREEALELNLVSGEMRLVQELQRESIVFPKNRVTDSYAKITIEDPYILIEFEKDSDFRKIVKDLRYTWSPNRVAWIRKIGSFAGILQDRVIEAGSKLLNAGYPVSILDQELRQKAIDGTYTPEPMRWILSHDPEKLLIWWKDEDDLLYKRARSISGASWNKAKQAVEVPIAHYKVVLEFMDLYDFIISEKADLTIQQYKEALAQVDEIEVAMSKEYTKKDGLQAILEQPDDIIDDLKD